MTLEDFFLNDYEAMRKRIKELEEELERLRPSKFGIRDLGHSQEMVMVGIQNSYSLRKCELTTEGIDGLLGLSDDELEEIAMQGSFGLWSPLIKVERKTLPFTVEVTDLTSTQKYATDGDSTYVSLDVSNLDGNDLGEWVPAEVEQQLISIAVYKLRKELEEAHNKLQEDQDKE